MNRMIICRPIWPEAWIGDPLLFVCLISPQSFSASLSFRLKEGGVQHWSWCEGGVFLGLSDWSWCKDSFIQILDLGQCSWSVHWSAKDVIPKAALEKDLQDSTSFCSNWCLASIFCNWQEKLWQITTVKFRQADFGIFWHAKLLGERNQGNHDHNPEVLAGAGAGAGAAIGAAAGAGMGANSGPGPAGAAASGTGGTSSGSASVAFALAFLSVRRLAMDTLPPSAPCRRRHFQHLSTLAL